MPPRHQTLPPAQTSSAREALQSFYCQLCSKGYSRMNDYEAHLSSYDHSHKQRLKDMKAMVRDPTAAARARKAEAKADGVISIKIGGEDGGASAGGFKKGGFKKSGFKSAFAPVEAVPQQQAAMEEQGGGSKKPEDGAVATVPGHERVDRKTEDGESDTEDEGYEVYDPRHPTD
ncbi:hypothetical protein MCOR02_000955 [Pyricularia oryzae]|uniref:C2H2-type domain-containing protein n=1 Tax=Pyricularia oryzae TaxID=318829 RepID=A0A4P7NV43_PYROR|nr:hypothetical protein MCOR02_000955 [Pyricularia oryzae]KAI6327116.1 hypothetical protein MCOR34_000545 [Pyricularia oryzae]KAI6459788.1 hypothetical protein MCOR17_006876 [Pyricularia oryzae]KAI6505108.1 hypothetical protein MCOR13_004439 [Pyricularia oryzae]QBZ66343.1 hypothetical protein PoMZ_13317 [Pyricularia oryzae]